MTQATGALSRLVMGYESTFKTDATEGFILPFVSNNVKSDRAKNASSVIRGNLNPAEPFDGNVSVSGTIVVPVDSISFWYWLKAAFGSPVTSGSGPYSHTFKLGNARPTLTIEKQFTDLDSPQYFKYNGCKVSTFGFSVGGDGELQANIGIVGARETIDTVSFDPAATEISLSKLQNFQAALSEGGVPIANANSCDFDINFNVDTNQYVIGGGGELGGVPDGVSAVSGNLATVFDDVSLLNKAMTATETSLEIIIQASASSLISILFPEVQYARNSPTIDGPQGIQIQLPWQGYYSEATEETAAQFVLTNTDEHP